MTLEIWLPVGLFLIGLPITYWLGRRNRQNPDLRFATDFDEVLVPDASLLSGGLSLTFDDSKIDRLCRTNVAIWNHRGDVIRRDDIVEGDPLRVVVDEADSILQIRVVARSRAQNGLSAQLDDKDRSSAEISFDFLDSGDGVVLEILHHLPVPAELVGTVKGAKIKDSGAVELGPDARALLQMSGPRRYWMARTVPGRITDIAMVVYMLLLAASSGLILANRQRAKLVDPSKYNLSTLSGQSEFAAHVPDTTDPFLATYFPWLTLAAAVVFLAFILWRFSSLSRRAIPRTIVSEDLQEVPAKRSSQRSDAASPPSLVADNRNLRLHIGDIVRHVDFGEGVVSRVHGSPPEQVADIRFQKAGIRRLLVSRAPIEVLSPAVAIGASPKGNPKASVNPKSR